ncbi:glycerate kinase type-2 family protein [Halovulum sp. GXIMD14794]
MDENALLRELFAAAVDAALPERIVPPFVPDRVPGKLVVVGAGKASAAMAAAVEAHYDGPMTGLVVTRYDHAVPCKHIEIVEAAHPVPDAAGAEGARRILDLLQSLGEDDVVLALISGGGSALLTLMAEGMDLDDAVTLNKALLASGAGIDAMNCVRRHLSQSNGGRLAAAAHPARMITLAISDVPGDDLLNIASGPTVGDPTTLEDARKLVERYKLDLPAHMMDALNDPSNESVKPDDPRLARAEAHLIAAPLASLEAAAEAARKHGLSVEIQGDALEGEARLLGAEFAELALERQKAMKPGDAPHVMISGGETTVTLPRDGRDLGDGGRNVDFLLGLAQRLDGAPGIWAMAGDTDGVDGLAEVAGAIVKPDTVARSGREALETALHRFDGHGFFAALGDQVVTGPTLTNVNDFRAILVQPL